MDVYNIDLTFDLLVGLNEVVLRHKYFMRGVEIKKWLRLSRASCLILLSMKNCIDMDIENICSKVTVSKQYVCNSCRILLNNRTPYVVVQYWIRLENQMFRPSITVIKFTFTQWSVFMSVLSDKIIIK